MTSDAPSVSVEALRFRYGPAAFELILDALSIARGEKQVLIGPSGSGKSTFLHLVAGILLPAAGRVRVEGVDWSERNEAERRRFRISRLGLIFQEFELLEHLSLRENILLPFLLERTLPLSGEVEERLVAMASRMGLAALLQRRPDQLSHGERQRVAICRALITEPALILADEPTGNLDPRTTAEVLELLLGEVDRRGTTLLMVTHDQGLVGAFDRVIDFGAPVAGARA